MRRIISSPAACPSLQRFPTLSHKRHDCKKKVTEHKICVLILSTSFGRNISYSQKTSGRYHKCTSVSTSSKRYACRTLIKLQYSRQFESTQISNFMKTRPVGTELFHVDGWTDGHDEANSRISKF